MEQINGMENAKAAIRFDVIRFPEVYGRSAKWISGDKVRTLGLLIRDDEIEGSRAEVRIDGEPIAYVYSPRYGASSFAMRSMCGALFKKCLHRSLRNLIKRRNKAAHGATEREGGAV